MDVSGYTSFESSTGTLENNSSSYTGDTTLYDSALDSLSATAYKSCNDMTEASKMESRCQVNEPQLGRIYHEIQRPACCARKVSKEERRDFCLRWINASQAPPLAEELPRKTEPRKCCSVHHKLAEKSDQRTDKIYSCRLHPQCDRWHGQMEASFVEPSRIKSGQIAAASPSCMASQKHQKQPQLERYPHGQKEASFVEPSRIKSGQKIDASPFCMASQKHQKQPQLERHPYGQMEASFVDPSRIQPGCMASQKHHEPGTKQPLLERHPHGHMPASLLEPSKLKLNQKRASCPCSMLSVNHHKLSMEPPQLEKHPNTRGHLVAAFKEPPSSRAFRKPNQIP
ncbi:uncharacterized protein LOC117897661 isoform X2 [Drosophila subobscura]|uniref:uncharacterized protein LOC117897661 isoform X2 n=1 Tax=Drosophila subobscura TaxID=7241 RepID=UPI00155A11C2|nr:uncharacterized protein LOC117897661 isoform X2 [Drosophila subobscura]